MSCVLAADNSQTSDCLWDPDEELLGNAVQPDEACPIDGTEQLKIHIISELAQT